MATKYECDRCNKQFVGSNEVHAVTYEKDTNQYREPNWQTQNKDLCVDCLKALHEWIQPIAKALPLQPVKKDDSKKL